MPTAAKNVRKTAKNKLGRTNPSNVIWFCLASTALIRYARWVKYCWRVSNSGSSCWSVTNLTTWVRSLVDARIKKNNPTDNNAVSRAVEERTGFCITTDHYGTNTSELSIRQPPRSWCILYLMQFDATKDSFLPQQCSSIEYSLCAVHRISHGYVECGCLSVSVVIAYRCDDAWTGSARPT